MLFRSQTLAHLVGIVDDGINNNMVGVTTPPWTKAHVDKRADKLGPEILEEWATYAPFVEARATNEGMRLSQLLFDAVTHEHDLRFALTQPGARNSDAVAVGLGFLVSRFEAREGGSPIHIIVDGMPVGTAAATADKPTLSTTAFDVIRSFGSRRTASQILSLDWSDDPSELLDRLVPFGLPLTPINE